MQKVGLLCKFKPPESVSVVAHLSAHGREVPDAAHYGPAAHHVEEIRHHAEFAAVPEGVSEARIILHKAIVNKTIRGIVNKNVKNSYRLDEMPR